MQATLPTEAWPIERVLGWARPLIVGILNVTPDSFSGDGLTDPVQAVARGLKLVEDGAAILDVGAESTRPESSRIGVDEELRRLSPVVAQLTARAFVSIDTYKADVAERMLDAGARMINDVSALRADPRMAEVIARHDAFVVLMYSKEAAEHPHATMTERHYADVVQEIAAFLLRRVEFAERAGIQRERIIIDPGMGRFISHEPRYSLQVIDELARFPQLGLNLPLMIGVSRKGFLGQNGDRDEASQLLAKQAVANGAALVRTHNVELAQQVLGLRGR